nr:large polymerase protein [Mumps virus genotype G]
MAGLNEILLPEVHLNSPIVRYKLFYYILHGQLPNDLEPDDLGPLANQNWKAIRAEESQVHARLKQIRVELIARIPSLRWTRSQREIAILIWPRILPILQAYDLRQSMQLPTVWEKLTQSTVNLISDGLERVVLHISNQLTGKANLFTRSRTGQDTKDYSIPSTRELSQIWFNNEWSGSVKTWFMIKYRMRQLITNQKTGELTDLVTIVDTRSTLCIITPELVALYSNEHKALTYLTFEMVLMVTDMLEGRLNVSSLCTASHYLSPLKKRIEILLTLVDDLALLMGDKVYGVVSSLESFVYAQLQYGDPVVDIKGTFYGFICNEILDLLTEDNIFTEEEANKVLLDLTSQFDNLSPDLTAELLCIMRLWGHPTLTASQAASKVRESMCAPKVLDFQTIMKTLAFFHAILINGYRRSHNGIWPPTTLHGNAPKSLIEMRHDNSELKYEYVLKNWKSISMLRIHKCFDASPDEDLSIFMKDKAISCPKQDWMGVFRRSLIKQRYRDANRPLPQPFNRRLLLNFLEDDRFDPIKELEYVTSGEYLRDPEFCASYSLKEKEIKATGRIFAKMTKRMRSCQVIAESLLANHAGKLMRENGVVLDQLKLTKSLLTMNQIGIISEHSRRSTADNMTLAHSGSNKHRINNSQFKKNKDNKHEMPDDGFEIAACFLTTDLTKYCLNWRYQVIIPFARTLNSMYGIPHLFEWIHLRLMRSTLYVGDPFNPPSDPTQLDLDTALNDDIFIVSPRGGIEGLCQKLWTMISISTIILSATEANTRVMSMVQGDNQAIAITTRVVRSLSHSEKKEQAYKASKLFFERLRANNHGIGHHLKEQETILSSDFFIYSKRVFYKGRILTQALKNVSKMCLTADILGDCSQASCSNLATTVMRLTENGVEKDLCYFLNAFMTIRQLCYDLVFPQTKSLSQDITNAYLNHPILISRLCLLPSQLGGLNFLSCSRLFNRNIGDPLVSAIADVKRLIKAGCLDIWVLYNILGRRPGKGKWSTLAADPYTLNIDYLVPSTTFLKKHAQYTLMERSVNPMLRGVFSENAAEEEEELAQYLLDREVVMPRVAHVILAQSSCGRRKQIQGYLDSTRTIIRYSLEVRPLSAKKLNTVIEYNLLYLSYNLEIIEKPNIVQPFLNAINVDTCSIDIARSLRKLSWATLLNGRPIEGLETPDPIELVHGCLIIGSDECEHCSSGDDKFTWFFLPKGIRLDNDPASNPPIRVPYIGSKTDERRVASMAYIKGASVSLKSALRLAGVYIWAFGDTEESWQDAYELASTRVNLTLEQLQSLTPLPTSANLVHRLDDGTTQLKFTPASSYAFSSFVHISNDCQVLEIDDQVTDSNLIYQQVMITGLALIETWNNPPINFSVYETTLHLHTGSSCCIRPVESCVVNPPLLPVPFINVPQMNKFVYDPEPLSLLEMEKIEDIAYQTRIGGLDQIPLLEKIPLLAHLTAKQMVNSITGLDEATSIVNDAVVQADYTSNWISECCYTYIDSVFVYSGWALLLELSYQMYYLRIQGIQGILDYVYMTLRRIPGMAITGISSTISHPRILRRCINLDVIAPINSPHIASLDYTKLSIDAVMWGTKQVLTNISQGIDYEIVVPSESQLTLSDRVLNLVARKLSLLAIIWANYNYPPKVKGMSPEDKCQALTTHLIQTVEYVEHIQIEKTNIRRMIIEPKLTAYPSNLFYLSRKLLNAIRDSEEGQFLIASYYNSFGFLEPILMESKIFNLNSSESASLTEFDFILNLELSEASLEKYSLPSLLMTAENMDNPFPQPPLHHVLRPLGLSSTSWYKTISVLNYISHMKISDGAHLYLAEGSGASMSLIETFLPGETIWYNSLFNSGENPPQRNFAPLPTQFIESVPYRLIQAGIAAGSGVVQSFYPLWNGNSDITDLSTKTSVEYIIHKVGADTCALVHVDLEGVPGSMNSMLERAQVHALLITVTVLKPGGLLILKASWEPFNRFSFLLTILWQFFSTIRILRSSYSDPNNHEVYIIATLAVDPTTSSFTTALNRARTLNEQGFSLIPPELVSEYWRRRVEQGQIIQDRIDKVISECVRDQYLTDNNIILQAGGTPSTRKWLDLPDYPSFNELQSEMARLITIHLKEVIEILKGQSSDHDTLLFTSYNVGPLGKINTILRLIVERILMYTVRNWCILPTQTRLTLRQSIELGEFRLRDVITPMEILKLSPNRKYLKSALNQSTFNHLMGETSDILLNRAYQKRIWKAIGCVIYCFGLLTPDVEDSERIDIDNDIPDYDIHGDII